MTIFHLVIRNKLDHTAIQHCGMKIWSSIIFANAVLIAKRQVHDEHESVHHCLGFIRIGSN